MFKNNTLELEEKFLIKNFILIPLPLGILGGVIGFVGLDFLYSLPNMHLHLPLSVPNAVYDVRGLTGRIKKVESASTVIDPFDNFVEMSNRKIRFPIFLTGAFHLGLFGYNVINYFFNGRSFDGDTPYSLNAGIGFLSLASSMYLKDQDPKLLIKQKEEKRLEELVPSSITS